LLAIAVLAPAFGLVNVPEDRAGFSANRMLSIKWCGGSLSFPTSRQEKRQSGDRIRIPLFLALLCLSMSPAVAAEEVPVRVAVGPYFGPMQNPRLQSIADNVPDLESTKILRVR
jgi:hypothetical protein